MLVGIGASGFMGIGLETVMGTYVAPTKFFPFRSEGLTYQQDTNFRRPIRAVADVIGAVPGYSHVEGDIEMELLADVLPYFLRCSRNTVVKTGTGPYTYVTTPSAASQPPGNTMSVTIVRNNQVFAYTGCVVGSMAFGQDGAMATATFSMVGMDEDEQTTPTPVWANQDPYGAGNYNLQVPTATQVFDVSNFTFTVEDNASPQYRLADYKKAAYVLYGERDVTMHLDRDFVDRTEYELFKALTSSSVSLQMTNGAGNSVTFNVPVAIRGTYDTGGLSGQGDVFRAGIDFRGIHDATSGKSYQITVVTTENIT